MQFCNICFTVTILIPALILAEKECNQTDTDLADRKQCNVASSDPIDVFKALPYYFSGYDFDNLPIIVIEIGHWDMFSISEVQDKLESELQRFEDVFYGCLERISNSSVVNIDGDETKIDEFVIIMDFDQFNLKMMSTSASSKLMLKLWKRWKSYDNAVAYGFYINLNAISGYFLSLTKTLTSKALGRSETFGNRKQAYIPALFRKIPKRNLAPWYGGDSQRFDTTRTCF